MLNAKDFSSQVRTIHAEFQLAAERVFKLTKFSRKDMGEVMLSYLEELGELCQEIKIYTGVAGTQHKQAGPDGIYGECADVWICAVSYCYALYEQPMQVGMSILGMSCDDFLDELKKPNTPMHRSSIEPFSMNIPRADDMQGLSMSLALHVDPDPYCFLNKINAKLDKWEKNVKYVE
jgi:hypothetical protein